MNIKHTYVPPPIDYVRHADLKVDLAPRIRNNPVIKVWSNGLVTVTPACNDGLTAIGDSLKDAWRKYENWMTR
jgi:hypothetical protein